MAYDYPGVIIEETEPAAPIAGVSTSIAAFIGIAERGPVGEPTFVASIDEFREKFGGPVIGAAPYYLPLAVDGFFRNGGTKAFITRVGTGKPNEAPLPAVADAATILASVVAPEGRALPAATVDVVLTSALDDALVAAGPGNIVGAAPLDDILLVDSGNLVLTVRNPAKFEVGDLVTLRKDSGGAQVSRTVVKVDVPAKTLTLDSDVATTGAGWTKVGVAVVATQVVLRLSPPDGLGATLPSLIPTGSVVRISDDDSNVAWGIVSQTSPAGVTLTQPIGTGFSPFRKPVLRTAEFSIIIHEGAKPARTYSRLSTSPSHPRWWGRSIEDPFARVVLEVGPGGLPVTFLGADPRPAATVGKALSGAVPDDPTAAWGLATSPGELKDLLALLAPIDQISLVAVPGLVDGAAQQVVLEHCESLADRFAIFDAPRETDLPKVVAHREDLVGGDLGFAGLYYPWIMIFDPVRNQIVPQPPSGHVAGIYARIDQRRGVHKAPANAVINGAIGVEVPLTDSQHGLLNPGGVNALRILQGRAQPIVWGARTTANNTNWQYINIRRLFLFLEESIQESLRGSVFEPNDLALWQKLKRTISEFLTRVWRDGALFGATAKDAFFVRIDEALNPPATRKLGRLYLEIGVQPVYPAEFIIVRIGIWDGGAEVAEI